MLVGWSVSKYRKKTKCRQKFLSRHQIATQDHDVKAVNKFFENVAKLRYLGMMVRNPNNMHEEIKDSQNSGNVSYHAVQNHLSSSDL